MTTSQPELLRRANEHLRDDDRGQRPEPVSQIGGHPALALLPATPPAPEAAPSTPPLPAVVLAKLICEINNGPRPFHPGLQQQHIALAVADDLVFHLRGLHASQPAPPRQAAMSRSVRAP